MQQSASAMDAAEENYRRNHREYVERRIHLDSFPYHIQIGADNRCNLKCGFCMAAADREKGMLHIQDRKLPRNPIEIYQRLTPFMRYWKFLSVTGPGESLLNPRLGELLKLVRSQSGCFIVITTNGVLIDEAMARLLVECGVDEVSISMDSLRKEVYEELRLNARFEDALAAVRHLNEARRSIGNGSPRISLTPNFMTTNIEELPSFIDYAAQNGIQKVQATPTQVYRRSWIGRSLLNHPQLTRKMAEEAERRARELHVEFANELRMVYWNRGGLRRLMRKKEEVDFPDNPSECRKPWSSLYIEPDGEVRPCCYQSPVYGNIFDEDLAGLWNGPAAHSLRQGMVDDDLPAACRECYEFNRHDPSIMIQV